MSTPSGHKVKLEQEKDVKTSFCSIPATLMLKLSEVETLPPVMSQVENPTAAKEIPDKRNGRAAQWDGLNFLFFSDFIVEVYFTRER